ncbi:MAG: radical SAM protein [Candidatus Aenigmarchaeota archaeon]|nr:radical SAM protein [Candidatus Aenigmarchaeota archaeon]
MKVVTGDPPLGVAYIASYLRERGISVDVLDTTFKNSYSFVEKIIKHQKPDILGISAISTMMNDAIEIGKIGKSNGIPLVILGGPGPSVQPEKTLKSENVDAVVIGEGEYSFDKIVERFERKEKIEDLIGIPNLYVKYQGKIKKCNERYFIKNLDDIPFPARDLLDMGKYFKHWFHLDSVSPRFRGTNIFTGRSCPFNCTFCQPTLKKMFGNFLRRRSPMNVVEELKHLKENYRINAFFIIDDLFMINSKYIDNFCNEILREGLDLRWSCQSRVDTIPSRVLIEKMHKAGLRLVDIGIESGSQRVLELYNKKITLNQAKKAIKIFRSCSIKTRGYFILGAPTESLKEMKQTISFAINSKLDEAAFSILTPFPGTYLYDMAKSKGWKITNEWASEHYYKKGGFLSNVLPENVIRKYQRLAFLGFYLHPYRARYLFNSALGLRRALAKLRCYFF